MKRIAIIIFVAALATLSVMLVRHKVPDVVSVDDTESAERVQLEIDLPIPMFTTGSRYIDVPNLEEPHRKHGPPLMVPAGIRNVALNKPVKASDENPLIGELKMITDGDKKETVEGRYVELDPFLQHVIIDLENRHKIFAVALWHYYSQPRVYFDVVVQTADDPDFTVNVNTIFNNDIDNSSGLGIGKDMHYIETNMGKLIDANCVEARYIRLYSNGNTANDLNHYVEVEVYGRPVKN